MRFPTLKIAHKLPLVVLGAALVVSACVGAASYIIASDTVTSITTNQLKSFAEQRAKSVVAYLGQVGADLTATAADVTKVGIVNDFANGFKNFKGGDASAGLRDMFITRNPNPPADRELMNTAMNSSEMYNFTHGNAHPIMLKLAQDRGYDDIFIFDKTGNLVYTVQKNDDFALNYGVDTALADTGLGKAFNAAVALTKPGEYVFVDTTLHAPQGDAPAAFIAEPVFDYMVKLKGVMVFQVPAAHIDQLLGDRTGLGQTGETFYAGTDHLLHSDSPFSEGRDNLVTAFPQSELTDAALKSGVEAMGRVAGYRGLDMLAAAVPFDFAGNRWAMVAVQDRNEALAPVFAMGALMLGVAGALLAIIAVVGFVFSRSITRPISRLTTIMEKLSSGELDVEVIGADKRDELGAMARAVEVFRGNAIQVNDLTEQERLGAERRTVERASMMQDLQRAFGAVVDAAVAGDFSRRVDTQFSDAELNRLAASVNNLVETVDRGLRETGVVLAALAKTDLTKRMQGDYQGAFGQLRDDTNRVCDTLSDVVAGLRRTSGSLKTATREILDGATDLSDRTSKQGATIQQTTQSMGQLAATVRDNAKRAEAANTKAQAVRQTASDGGIVMGKATDAMERITASSGKISNIIGLIDDIAFQTNLLALNASVEAARAGEAGQGFAVVAVEVRRLAQSAAKASGEVKGLIDESGAEVLGGSRLVAEAAAKLNAMLDAAKENSVLIEEIATASREQAAAIAEVSIAMRTLDEMTQHNAALVEETNAAIEQTEAQAVELDHVVEIFHIESAAPAAPDGEDIRAARAKPATARRRNYLAEGNAALDWQEF